MVENDLSFELIKFKNLKNKEIYHEKYNILLIVLFFLFGILSIYFYNLIKDTKNNKESDIQQNPKTFQGKQKMLKFLFHANLLRFISLFYIVLFYNKTAFDIIAFFNFIFHITPPFIYLLGFYVYIGFIIEKFYEISLDKRKVVLLPTLKLILYFSFILTISLSIVTSIIKNFKSSYYLIFGIVCFNYLMISILYLLYGNRIVKFYWKELDNNTTRNRNLKETIFCRIILATCIVGFSYFGIGVLYGLVSIGFFEKPYPDFIELNLLDFINFSCCELLSSFIVGFTQKHKKNSFKEFCESEDFLNSIEDLKVKCEIKKHTNVNSSPFLKDDKSEEIIVESPFNKKRN